MSIRHLISGAGIALALLLAVNCGCRKRSPDESFAAGLAYAEKGSLQKAMDAYTDALEVYPTGLRPTSAAA